MLRFIIGVTILFFCLAINGQTYDYLQKKVDANRQRFDVFGASVDVNGDFAIVGIPGDDEDQNESNYVDFAGSAIVYKRNNNGEWDFYQKIVAPDRIALGTFGYSVKIHEGQILVSAPQDATDEIGGNYVFRSGSIYVYELVGNTWTFVRKMVAPDRGLPSGLFGWSMDLDGDMMIVGARSDQIEADGVTVGVDGGSAYFYEKDNTGVWNFVQKVVAFDRVTNDHFGFSVGITSAGRAVVGAPQQDRDQNGMNNVVNSGAIYIYEKTGATWNFVQKKVLTGRNPFDEYGLAVGIEGDRIVSGAPRHNVGTQVVGKIEVFERLNSTTWNLLGGRVSNVTTNLSFGGYGAAIEMEGNKLFVGAPAESAGFTFFRGAVYSYELDPFGVAGYGVGTQLIPASHNIGQTTFGSCIAVDNDKLIVGAIGDMTDENNANAVSMISPPSQPDTDSIGAVHFFQQCIQANVPQINPSTPSAQICLGDSVQLVLNSSSSLNSTREWFWYTGSYATGTLVDSTDTIWVSPTTTTTYSVAGEGYCVAPNTSDSVATITITVNTPPTITANASPGTSICAGESVTLTGGGGVSYVWDSGVTDGVSFTPTINGLYKVVGTDANGCVDSTTIGVTIGALPTVGINYSGSSTICSGTSVTLSGTGTVNYSWNNGVTDGTAFTPLATNTYTVTGTNASGCSDTEDITITVIAGPTVTANAGVTTICEGASVSLSAMGADAYSWDNGLGAGQTHTVTPTSTTTYTVTGTQNATMCTDTDAITIVVNS
ncbi:MAG: hypothetical protein N4A35_01875, partial [Flavobacteriales bacterium]|nr:hypothetical protein [Flavobacteriales bacterium]